MPDEPRPHDAPLHAPVQVTQTTGQLTVINTGTVLHQTNVQEGSAVVHVHLPQTTRPAVSRQTNLPIRNTQFVGRRPELGALAQLFDEGASGRGAPVCLTGMGGVGKSHLARAFGYARLATYEHICWVNAEGDDLTAAIGALALDPLGQEIAVDRTSQDLARAAVAALERGGRALLILDDVRHDGAWRRWLPKTGAVDVLITSRRTDLSNVRRVAVETLSEEDGLDLLRGDTPLKRRDRPLLRALAARLGQLPLALAIAARLLRSGAWTPQDLLAHIDAIGAVDWSASLPTPEDTEERPPQLAALFDLSVGQLRTEDPVQDVARALLFASGWLGPAVVPLDLAVGVAEEIAGRTVDHTRVRQALMRLFACSLAHPGHQGGFVVHQLVREYAVRSGPPTTRAATLRALADRAARTKTDSLSLLSLDAVRAHLEAGVSLVEPSDPAELGIIAVRLAQLLGRRGEFEAQRAWSLRALRATRSPVWRAYLLNEAGLAWVELGRFTRGLCCSEAALRVQETALGANHPQGAITRMYAGRALHRQGRYDEAVRHYEGARTALEAAEAAATADERHRLRIERASLLTLIGQTAHRRGRYADARASHQAALGLIQEALGPEHPHTAQVTHAIAETYAAEGRWSEARTGAEGALRLQRRALGRSHPQVAIALHTLGQVEAGEGNLDAALRCFQGCLEIQRRALGEDHSFTASTHISVGTALSALGRTQEALPHVTRALDVHRKHLGDEHPETALGWYYLGQVHQELGACAEAEAALTRCLEIQLHAVGETHPHTAYTLVALADLARQRSRWGDAQGWAIRGRAVLTSLQAMRQSVDTDLLYQLSRIETSLMNSASPPMEDDDRGADVDG